MALHTPSDQPTQTETEESPPPFSNPAENSQRQTPTPESKTEVTPSTVPNAGFSSNLARLRQKALGNMTHAKKTPAPPTTTDALDESQATEEKKLRPDSKHASVIADVADKLGEMSGKKTEETKQEQVPTGKTTDNTKKSTEASKETVESAPPSNIPLVRTFKSDAENAILKNQTSVVDIMTAQQRQQKQPSTLGETVRKAPRSTVSKLSVILMWSSAAFVLFAIAFASFFIFRFITSDRNIDKPELVAPNETVKHDITEQSSRQILEGLRRVRDSNQSELGALVELQIVKQTGGQDDNISSTKIVPTSEFFERLNTRAPGNLIRATTDEMTIGLHKLVNNEVFWVFKVDDYQNASRGMREWEEDIRKDLSPLFGEVEYTTQPASTPSQTTEIGSPTSTIKYDPDPIITIPDDEYEDVTVANTAGRGLKGEGGEYVFIWSMPDRDTVAIASSYETMERLITRMQERAR